MQQVDRDFLPFPAEWSLGGHSMGAFAAMRLAVELQPTNLVFWGMGPFTEARTDISSIGCPVLVIQGSNDMLCKYTPESREEFRRALPLHYVEKLIRGGTHDGFATYPNNPIFDGVPGIPKEKQRRLVVAATSNFLLQSKRQELRL
jgi:pimeloyl-ACP methyl ester carboxylesterase